MDDDQESTPEATRAAIDQVAAVVRDKLPGQIAMAGEVLDAVGDRDLALTRLILHFDGQHPGAVRVIAAAALIRLAEAERRKRFSWWDRVCGRHLRRLPARLCTAPEDVWCPNHGRCVCPDRLALSDVRCPLHNPNSAHLWHPTGRTER